MKKTINIALILLVLLFPVIILAHPGRTASDGCHYCRTNCDSWGVVWNQRHCHDGTTYTPPPTPPQPSAPEPEPQKIDPTTFSVTLGQVTQIVDGDTFKVNLEGEIFTVRLIGIDTPETVDPRKPVECFGKEATAHLSTLIDGATIYLTKDKIGDTVDIYGRLLRYISLGGNDIDAQMIKDGYAYAYTKYPFDRKDEYVQYQKEAEANKIGLWAPGVCGNPEEEVEAGTVAGVATEEENQADLSEKKPQETLNLEVNQPGTSESNDSDFGIGVIIVIIATGVGVYYFIKRRKKK